MMVKTTTAPISDHNPALAIPICLPAAKTNIAVLKLIKKVKRPTVK